MRDSRGFSCRRAAAGTDHCLHFRQSRCGTAHCRHHQAAGCFARLLQPSPTIIIVRRRQLRQATATIARRRQLPSETFRFAPSRRLPLRSLRVLATFVARPGASRSAFAPPIHMAMGGHGFREGTACRLPRQHHTPPSYRQHSRSDTSPTILPTHLNRHLRMHPRRRYRWLAVTQGHQVLTEGHSAATLSVRCCPAIS